MPDLVDLMTSEPRDGFVYLWDAVLWVANRDGAPGDADIEGSFDGAEQDVVDALGRGALVAESANAEGVYESIPRGMWPLASSRDPFEQHPTIRYVDPTAESGFGGRLMSAGQEWRGVRVRKRDVLRLWPISEERQARRGRTPLFDWPTFEMAALKLLEETGGIDPKTGRAWLPEALVAEMRVWCERNWPKVPARSTMQPHSDKAKRRFCDRRRNQPGNRA